MMELAVNKFNDDYEEFDYLEEISYTDDIEEDDNVEGKEKVAVALRFDPEKDTAPRIVAAGRGEAAKQIIELAEESDIPLYQEQSVAEGLSQFEVGAVIPESLYELIAEVLIFLHHLDEDWVDEKMGDYEDYEDYEDYDI